MTTDSRNILFIQICRKNIEMFYHYSVLDIFIQLFLQKKCDIMYFLFLLFQTKEKKNQATWGSKVKIQLLGTKTHHGGVSEKSATISWPLCGQFHFWGQTSRQTDRTSFKIHNVAVSILFLSFSDIKLVLWRKHNLILQIIKVSDESPVRLIICIPIEPYFVAVRF